MEWQSQLKGDSLNWLLASDVPGVRYLALRDLVGLPEGDAEAPVARQRIGTGRSRQFSKR
jgi:hypothetical protein